MIDLLRHILFRDFWLKLLSTVFAVIIWISVSKLFLRREVTPVIGTFGTHMIEQVYREIPILVRVPAAEARSVSVEPNRVEITVRGETALMQKLRRQDIHAEIDLTGISSANSLRKQIEVRLPNGLVATRVAPGDVEVIVPPQN
ncbi:MAG TPA: CdaR family protein [Verrucomicrobiae bacterium]|nr:CdaR family protein [Verrucomicrobiae bacterium]